MSSTITTTAAGATPKLEHVLDDLCTRFLLNLPASEFESFERLFFAVESAHWFYDDFYREQHTALPRLQLKAFAQRLFEHTPLLQPYAGNVDALVAEFKMYKQQVPTCGAAMLNPTLDKVLLVRSWGSGAKWGFPKGKMAKGESELQAAIREVHEETGFDFSPYADNNTYYIDSMMCGRLNRIYVVPNVPESTRFETQTRKEISKIEWISVATLPDYKDKQQARSPPKANGNNVADQIPANKFVHVHPYTSRLHKWIKRQRKARARANGNGATVSGNSAAPNGNGLPPAAAPSRSKETNGRVKANGEGGTEGGGNAASGAKLPEGSPRSKRNRKNRKRHDSKDVETFGLSGGARALTDAERDQMFQSYVKEADRRARELKLGEDEWVSSGRRMPRSPLFVPRTPAAAGTLPSLSPLFTFNSEAIIARMNKAGVDV